MDENTALKEEQLKELESKADKTKDDVSDTRKELLYLEVYSRRENLKFQGIPESTQSSVGRKESGVNRLLEERFRNRGHKKYRTNLKVGTDCTRQRKKSGKGNHHRLFSKTL